MEHTTKSKTLMGVVVIVVTLALAVSINVLMERRVSALSFNDVTNFFQTFLTSDRYQTPTSETTQPAQKAITKQTSPGSNPGSIESSNSEAGYTDEPLPKVAPIKVDITALEQSRKAKSAHLPITGSGITAGNGASSGVILQATSSGWQLMGLMWYWWLAGLALVVLMTKFSAYYLKTRLNYALINRTAMYLLSIMPMLILNKT